MILGIGSSCAIACETLFGFSYLFTKQVIGQASELALLGWRFLIAAIVIIACAACGVIKINIIGKPLRPVLLIAMFSPVVYFIGETFGISQTTASESGAFLACIPVASLIASTLILKKKPKKNQVIGIIVTLVGVLITIFAVGAGTSLSIAGYAALLIAVIAYALYAVFVEKAEGYTGEEITLVMLSAGSVVFVSLALLEAAVTGDVASFIRLPFTNRSFLIACLYQGIGCSVLAFFLSNVAIAKIGVNKTSSFIGIATMVSIAAGVLILREPFTAFQMAGVILIITGVYIANSRFKKNQTHKDSHIAVSKDGRTVILEEREKIMLIDITLQITPKMVTDAQGNEKKALVGHLGTHFDVMNKEFPLEYTRRKGIVFDVSDITDRDIDVCDVDLSQVGADMFVAFYTGFIEEEGYGSKVYFTEHPQLSDELIDVYWKREYLSSVWISPESDEAKSIRQRISIALTVGCSLSRISAI